MLDEPAVLVLVGTAGVAATFAGFSGVVATFGRRAHGEWPPEDRFRLRNLLVLSLGACLFSLVPLVGDLWRVPSDTVWQVASGLLGASCAAYLVHATPQLRALRRTRRHVLPVWASAVFVTTLVVTGVLQVLNASAGVERGAGPYVAGLALVLADACLQFAFLVLAPLAARDQGDRSRSTPPP